MPGFNRTQVWFRQHPVVTGLLMVPVVLVVTVLADLVADAFDLPWAAWLVLMALCVAAGFALSRVLIGFLMGRE